MSRSRSRITSALLILILAVPGPFARLWETILEIWAPISHEGCMIDLHGVCQPPAATPTSDEGCSMDPHGVCKPGS